MAERVFDEDFLKKLEYLHIVSTKLVAGRTRADRRSKRQGSGLEFADHRDYAPGDDFRYLDWNLYGRLDKLLLRLFEEEEDLSVAFLLDTSLSMGMGEPTKLDYSKRVVAALAYIALANLDRVNIAAFADGVKLQLSPKRGKGQIFSVLEFLEALPVAGETRMTEAFRDFALRSRRRGLAVVVSDFFDHGGFQDPLNFLRYDRFEIFCIQVTQPDDFTPPVRGDVRLVDRETGQTQLLTVSRPVVRAYEESFKRFCRGLEGFCRERAIGFAQASTAVPFEELVLKILRRGGFLT